MAANTNPEQIVTGYLNAEDASALDVELMQSPGFTLEQLMELAGLSVAQAVYDVLQEETQNDNHDDVPNATKSKKKILLVCGPGNNGGDGLVAARHLVLFGHECVVVYPKRSKKQPHYTNLVKTCDDLGIPVLDEMPLDVSDFDAMVDAIFGFSFQGTPREPFATILEQMMAAQTSHRIPVVSVDVPSGWDVDGGDQAGTGFAPEILISLTAPKLSSKHFKGRHFVGGRFLPPTLAQKYGIQMPPYPGTSQVMEITPKKEESWEEQYAAYCAEKEMKQPVDEKDVGASSEKVNPECWEAQYHQHCVEKEAELARKEAEAKAQNSES